MKDEAGSGPVEWGSDKVEALRAAHVVPAGRSGGKHCEVSGWDPEVGIADLSGREWGKERGLPEITRLSCLARIS